MMSTVLSWYLADANQNKHHKERTMDKTIMLVAAQLTMATCSLLSPKERLLNDASKRVRTEYLSHVAYLTEQLAHKKDAQ